jgi:sulfite exporter TauE/SafE
MMFLAAGFLLGLAGSLHCLGMCGPLVLFARRPGSSARRPEPAAVPPAERPPDRFLRGPAAVQFLVHQASRISVYVALGVFAGWTGGAIAGSGWRSGLAIAAGLLLIAQAVGLAGGGIGTRWGRLIAPLTVKLGALSRVMTSRGLARAAALGVVNGLLPCGLVYAALLAAAGLGSVPAAVGFMAAFGLGSLPALAALVYSAQVAMPRAPRLLRRAAPVALALVGLMLIARGLPSGRPGPEPEGPGLHLHVR